MQVVELLHGKYKLKTNFSHIVSIIAEFCGLFIDTQNFQCDNKVIWLTKACDKRQNIFLRLSCNFGFNTKRIFHLMFYWISR